jgi:hypothetical protein
MDAEDLSECRETKCPYCLNKKKYYATGCEKFEAAVREFGVEAALEYFATPKNLWYIWSKEIDREHNEKHNKK